MNIDKYTKKAYGFFEKTKKEQREKADKLIKIIEKLEIAEGDLKQQLAGTKHKKEGEKKFKELQVIEKILKKARNRLDELTKV